MKSINKVTSLEKPDKIQVLGKNSYYYNYDIQPIKIEEYNDGKVVIVDGWSFTPIYIKGTPSYKECVRHIIRAYISQEEEFDLINSYNKSIMQGASTYEDNDYLSYLSLLDNIKKEVKEAFSYESSK